MDKTKILEIIENRILYNNGKSLSIQGFSFIRGDKNIPKLSVVYTFPTAGAKKIACKVQDDKGGERTEIIELEVK